MNPKCVAIASMDKDYADAAKVFIYTFKYYHPDIPIKIYIIDDYQPDESLTNIHSDVTFIHFNASKVHDFINKNNTNINKKSFDNNCYDSSKIYNMFAYIEAIDELISTNKYDVIIKSDLDTLWCGSIVNDITEFVNSNLPIGVSKEKAPIEHIKLGSDGLLQQHLENGGHFCVGITLYNAKVITTSVLDTVIKTMQTYGISKFVYLDQDALLLSYRDKFILNGVYNMTSFPIPQITDVYVLHYNNPFKPFSKVDKPLLIYNPLFHTYKLYLTIAKSIKCREQFIDQINNNISILDKFFIQDNRPHRDIKLILSKCLEMLK